MERDRSVPIRSHGEHVRQRNKHLIRAGMATVGAVVTAGAVHPAAGIAVGAAAFREVLHAIDHQEDKKKRR